MKIRGKLIIMLLVFFAGIVIGRLIHTSPDASKYKLVDLGPATIKPTKVKSFDEIVSAPDTTQPIRSTTAKQSEPNFYRDGAYQYLRRVIGNAEIQSWEVSPTTHTIYFTAYDGFGKLRKYYITDDGRTCPVGYYYPEKTETDGLRDEVEQTNDEIAKLKDQMDEFEKEAQWNDLKHRINELHRDTGLINGKPMEQATDLDYIYEKVKHFPYE